MAASVERTRCKRQIPNGESWGQYNPVQNEWMLKPSGAKHQDSTSGALVAEGRVGAGKRRVPRSDNTGLYDPIRNTWIEPPANVRMREGLSYHPRGIFASYGRQN